MRHEDRVEVTRVRRVLAMARIGDAIREAREKKGVSLRWLAEKIGVSAPFLSDVEHGRRMALRHLGTIAKMLGTTERALFGDCGFCRHCDGTGLEPPFPLSGATSEPSPR